MDQEFLGQNGDVAFQSERCTAVLNLSPREALHKNVDLGYNFPNILPNYIRNFFWLCKHCIMNDIHIKTCRSPLLIQTSKNSSYHLSLFSKLNFTIFVKRSQFLQAAFFYRWLFQENFPFLAACKISIKDNCNDSQIVSSQKVAYSLSDSFYLQYLLICLYDRTASIWN